MEQAAGDSGEESKDVESEGILEQPISTIVFEGVCMEEQPESIQSEPNQNHVAPEVVVDDGPSKSFTDEDTEVSKAAEVESEAPPGRESPVVSLGVLVAGIPEAALRAAFANECSRRRKSKLPWSDAIALLRREQVGAPL